MSKRFAIAEALAKALVVAALAGIGGAAAADFTLINPAGAPRVSGKVTGEAPLAVVAGRQAARFTSRGWVTIPTRDHFSPLRGSLEVDVCPDWPTGDRARHTLFHIGENDANSHFTLFKLEGPSIRFVVKHDPSTYANIDYPIPAWKPGEWHQVRISWQMADDRLLLLMQVDDGEVRHFLGGRPDCRPRRTCRPR